MGIATSLEKRIEPQLRKLARYLVYIGGVVLTGIAVLTVVSIVGRLLVFVGLGPIPGDFELVEMGCGVAIFAFLPWCQLNRGHVSVDVLSDRFSAPVQRFLILLGDLAISLIALVIVWRMWMGMGERATWFSQPVRDFLGFGYKPFSAETTFILGMPLWIGYAAAMLGAALFAVIAVFTVWRSLNDLLDRRALP